MKNYIYKGRQFQFDEKDVPKGSVPLDEFTKVLVAPVQQPEPEQKPATKARGVKNK